MEKEEVQKQIAVIIDELLESYDDGFYGKPPSNISSEEDRIRLTHELITLYRVLNLFRIESSINNKLWE